MVWREIFIFICKDPEDMLGCYIVKNGLGVLKLWMYMKELMSLMFNFGNVCDMTRSENGIRGITSISIHSPFPLKMVPESNI